LRAHRARRAAERPLDAPRRREHVDRERKARAAHLLEQQHGPLRLRLAAGDLGHLAVPVDLTRDALHVPLGVAGFEELAQRAEAHSSSPSRQPSPPFSPSTPSSLSVNPETSAFTSVGLRYQGGETGITITPSRESFAMFSSAIVESGVSRTHTTMRMRSLS